MRRFACAWSGTEPIRPTWCGGTRCQWAGHPGRWSRSTTADPHDVQQCPASTALPVTTRWFGRPRRSRRAWSPPSPAPASCAPSVTLVGVGWCLPIEVGAPVDGRPPVGAMSGRSPAFLEQLLVQLPEALPLGLQPGPLGGHILQGRPGDREGRPGHGVGGPAWVGAAGPGHEPEVAVAVLAGQRGQQARRERGPADVLGLDLQHVLLVGELEPLLVVVIPPPATVLRIVTGTTGWSAIQVPAAPLAHQQPPRPIRTAPFHGKDARHGHGRAAASGPGP